MKIVLIKIGGILMVLLAIAAAFIIIPDKIKSGEAECWNAAPFIFSLSFLLVFGIMLIGYKKSE